MNYSTQRKGVNYCVDYYVELLGVLYILCEDQDAVCEAGIPVCNEAYVREVKEFFRNASYAKLTKTLELFSDQYWFNYDAPVRLMLMLSNNHPIDKEELFRERKTIPDALFDQFLEDLTAFEQESNFAAFYAAHLPMYAQLVDRFIEDYEAFNSHEFLLSVMGITPDCAFHINFMVGITNANYGAAVGRNVYCNICPYDKTRYAPQPDYSYSPIYYSTLVLHEFAHAFVNSTVALYRGRIHAIDVSRYDKDLDVSDYGDSVETLINETIIRALECLYVMKAFPDQYEAYVDFNVDEGYSKLTDVINILSVSVDIDKVIKIFE